jgi:hypothetical protein
MPTTFKHRIVFPIASIVVGFVVIALVLEVILRFLPVCDAQRRLPVNERDPIFRFEPNRTIRWSSGWNFSMTNTLRVNNDGFLSGIDYHADDPGRLLAVVGDSYVEALMVPYEETGQGRMQKALDGRGRVYAFAIRGSPLSQYLAMAEYARGKYRPDAMTVVIIGNDFDESLLAYKSEPGYHYFAEREDGSLELQRVDYTPGRTKALVRHSALARYLLINLELLLVPSRLRDKLTARGSPTAYVGSTPSAAGEERVARSKRGVDAFLEELPARSGLDKSRILLVVDGIRPHLYDPAMLESANGSFFDVMRRYFLDRANETGYEVIDMQPLFMAHFARFGRRFEYTNDDHWNPLGHELFFEAMNGSAVMKRFRDLEAP